MTLILLHNGPKCRRSDAGNSEMPKISCKVLPLVLPSGHHCAGVALGLALGEETEMSQSPLSGDQLRVPDGHWTG